MNRSVFRRYFLPGLVCQSIVIGGGYGTGRELVEFFLVKSRGPLGGLLAIGVATAIFSIVSMVTFELARVWGAFDYRHFFQKLLGPAWRIFEGCYLGLLLIILAVAAAAAGSIVEETFGLDYWIGVGIVMLAVGGLVFGGNKSIERFFSAWSILLYGLYLVFFLWCLKSFGSLISENLTAEPIGTSWLIAGVSYAGYNLTAPFVLATLRLHQTRRETFIAGALTGPLVMIPGLLFFLATVGQYPEIMEAVVPANDLLEILGSRSFQVVFQVILFGTLVETGAGLIHAFNERISGLRAEEDKELPSWVRPAVAVGLLTIATFVSQFGLIDLIARGYGTLTWGFIFIYVLPVLTVGVWKLRGSHR
ncbi:MAG: hypothetical protein VX291_01610 [Gemmatimonadota bacterium]|nr:hypothetical protein [Gemmatimonadota bacterium]